MCSKSLKKSSTNKKKDFWSQFTFKIIKKYKSKFIIQIHKNKKFAYEKKQLKSQTHCHFCKKLISRKNYTVHVYNQHFKCKSKNLENSIVKKSNNNKNLDNSQENIILNNYISFKNNKLGNSTNNNNSIFSGSNIHNQIMENIHSVDIPEFLSSISKNESDNNISKMFKCYGNIFNYNKLQKINSINSEDEYSKDYSIKSEYVSISNGMIPIRFHQTILKV